MADFRKTTPRRRESVPIRRAYSDYKSMLREDFHSRCGYCGDHDFFSETFYEIDHFVPKKWLKKISPTAYSNLVYSCRSCNNHKRAKWPTESEDIHNDGERGFIDPCDEAYADQFERLTDGSIHPVTVLGSWMWQSLHLGNPAHRLKWKLEEVKCLLDEIRNLETDDTEEIKQINKLYLLYLALEEQFRGKPNFD